MDKLQANSLKELLDTWEDVDKLQEIVSSATNKKIESICEQKICNTLKKKGYNIRNHIFQQNRFVLEVDIPEWEKCWWSMEDDEDKDGTFLMSGVWCDQEKKVAKKYKAMLSTFFNHFDDEYIGWNWHKDYELKDEFWIDIDNHSRKFVNFVVNEIERVRKETKGIKL